MTSPEVHVLVALGKLVHDADYSMRNYEVAIVGLEEQLAKRKKQLVEATEEKFAVREEVNKLGVDPDKAVMAYNDWLTGKNRG